MSTSTPSIASRAGSWHRQPRARRAILACIAADERPRVAFDTYVLTRDAYTVPGGILGRKVEAIFHAYGAAAVAYGDETGDYSYADEWCRAPKPADAIAAAFEEADRAKGAVA